LVNRKYYAQTERRDLGLDFLRGYFVFVMTINHFGAFPAWTLPLTGGNKLWVSAAEGFILISGLVLGILYRQRAAQKGWRWSAKQIGQRAWQLYLLGAVGRLILATGDYVMWLLWERPSHVPTNYWHLLEGALLHTRYDLAYVDLLPLYAILLPLGLVAVYFLSRGKWKQVILVSCLLWYMARTDPAALKLLRMGFNVFSWQFPFILSVIIGYYRQEIGCWWGKRPFPRLSSTLLIGSGLTLLIISYQVAFHGLWPGIDWEQVNSLLFNKSFIAPGRMIAAFWIFAAIYEFVTQFWTAWQRLFGWLLLPLGQNALIAYLVQGFLSYFVSHLPGYPFPDHDPVVMGFLHLGAVLFVWQITRMTARFLDNPRLTWPTLSNKLEASSEANG
jgi:hypothetical protein